ncbi:hypothetical protein [Gemmatimonas sp.]|uniref:hypothetical protein n=1 Tax=Gemmatimonas sp. TaxID=1962908 RepID=UPI00286A529C|nr:hypothetical protein [Gemmatimonas sp.]
MTDRPEQHRTPEDDQPDTPLEPWMLELAREAADELDADVVVPREMMWARINRDRHAESGAMSSSPVTRVFPWTRVWTRVAAIAAVLVGGVAIGRYVVPAAPTMVAATDSVPLSNERARQGARLGPDALAELPQSSDPVRVAMGEHLARTVALLTTVRDQDPSMGPGADVSAWARDLLSTTRLLIDEPQRRDERTRRLLQDLELVLVQIIQARGSAPETQRAPKETIRETNLLPRVRAIVTASRPIEETINSLTYGGD